MRGLVAAIVLGALTAGCTPAGVLVARDGSHRLVARDPQSGVTVILTTGAWDGNPREFDQRVTVVHALVANMGDRPVLLAPGDIELHDTRGFRHALLDAGGTFHQQAGNTGAGIAPIDSSRPDPRGYDPGRSRNFDPLAASHDEVHRAALPWGALQPGTQMRGFLYFDRIEGTSNQARLVWHIGTPTHEPIVDLKFDLYVARPRKTS